MNGCLVPSASIAIHEYECSSNLDKVVEGEVALITIEL